MWVTYWNAQNAVTSSILIVTGCGIKKLLLALVSARGLGKHGFSGRGETLRSNVDRRCLAEAMLDPILPQVAGDPRCLVEVKRPRSFTPFVLTAGKNSKIV